MRIRFIKLIFLLIYLNFNFLALSFAANKENLANNLLPQIKKDKLVDKQNQKILLNLNNIEKVFKENNKELEILRSRIDQAQRILKSQLSLWYPKINLNSSNLPSYISGFNNNKNSDDTASEKFTTSLNLNFEWDFIDFSRNPNINIAKLNLDKAKIAFKIKYRELFIETLELFLKFKSSIEEIKVAKQAIAVSEISLRDANDRFKGGIGNKLEVLEAATQLRKDQQFLAKTIGDSQKNKNILLIKLNLKDNDIFLDDSNLVISGIWETSLNKSLVNARDSREEFKDLELDQQINKNEGYLKSSSKKPKISIYNTYTISSVNGESDVLNPDTSKNTESEENTVGIKFNWTLFDGGATKQNYKSTKEREKELKITYEVSEEQIINDIKNQFIDLNVSMKNILRSHQQILSAKEALELALMRLKAGVTNQREVVSNLSDLTDSKSRYIQAVTNYNINIEKLKLNTGIKTLNGCNDFFKNENNFLQEEIYQDLSYDLLENICVSDVLQ